MAGQPAIDNEARERAAVVAGRLDAHEKYCAERWTTTTKAIDSLEDGIKDLNEKMSKNIGKVHEKIDMLSRYIIWGLIGIAAFAVVQWLLYAKVVLPGG
jgi:uncharacterized protein Yka (UPF0111/DUF47 family)